MTEITDLSPTDSSNTSVTGESLDGSIANMGRMDNTLQAILGMFGRWTSSDTIASAGTTDIGAQAEAYLSVSGTTTITSFGTVRAGTIRFLQFSGILTLTYNATSLILPGAASITTAAGDTAVFVSEGSGNWRCLSYFRSSGGPLVNNALNVPGNLSIVASVAANALTVAIKGFDGNDPSAANPVPIPFRSATLNSGDVDVLTLTAATSFVVSSGSTLGTTNAVPANLVIVGFNDAGTFRLGVINPLILPVTDGIASSTAEGGAGAADSAGVYYTGTAVASKAFTVLGYLTVTEATAGAWATAPTVVQTATAPAVNNAVPAATGWVSYVPTFTGMGTVTNISMWSRRSVDTLEVRGYFTSGTATATEARVSLGFNGVNGNVTSSATKVAAIQVTGPAGAADVTQTVSLVPLIESNVGYVTFGFQDGSSAGLTKRNGNAIFNTGAKYSFMFSVPIQGW